MNPKLRNFLISTLLVVALAAAADACPTCKDGLNEDGGNLMRGYFWSIMFMMSMPFIILTGLSGMFYLDVRRAKRLPPKGPELDSSA